MAAKVAAFINFKGGVGKTSNVVNLGACLAHHQRKRVLIVDLDPQANSTFWLLQPSQWEALSRDRTRSVAQIFFDAGDRTNFFRFEEAVVRGVPRTSRGFPRIERLDLLPTTLDLLEAEQELYRVGYDPPFFKVLFNQLQPQREQYDYILLDCPPNLYPVMRNAMFFADYYFVPYMPDYLSLSGLHMLARMIRKYEVELAPWYDGPLSSRLTGVIVNRYKQNGNVFAQALTELKLELGDLRAQGLANTNVNVLEPVVRDCVRLAECTNFHLPVILHREDAISAEDYGRLAEAFAAQLEHPLPV